MTAQDPESIHQARRRRQQVVHMTGLRKFVIKNYAEHSEAADSFDVRTWYSGAAIGLICLACRP